MSRLLFVYYRVRDADAACALSAVQALQARLVAAHPGLDARLLRRPESSADGLQTWMETYGVRAPNADGSRAEADNGITPAIEADIARCADTLAPHIVGPRHTEVFVPCA